jgi:hypothetical protein
MSENGFETIGEIKVHHLNNDAKILLQRQRNKFVSEDKIQFGLARSFVNENKETVTLPGPSIQLEQLPELIGMLTEAYEKYSGCKIPETKSEKTNTFADMLDQ